MVELFLLAVGLLVTGLLALAKVVFIITALTWLWVWIPTFVAVLIITGIWLPDLDIHH